MKRKQKTSLSAQSEIKPGDIIWVNYKKTEWPAKVSQVYPKKITYHYFPLEVPRGNTFKALPKAVKLMQADDSIPPNADNELRLAFNQAKQMLENPGEQITFNNSSGSSELNGTQTEVDMNESQNLDTPSASAKKKKTKEVAKELRSEHDPDEPEHEDEANGDHFVNFTVGDVVTVSSEIGTWPGKILEIFDDYTTCKLFPLAENNEPCRVVWDNIQPFPVDDLDEYMEAMKDNENLYSAFKDVKRYLEGLNGLEEEEDAKPQSTEAQDTGRKRKAVASERDSEADTEQVMTTRTRAKRRQQGNEKGSKKAANTNSASSAVPTVSIVKKVLCKVPGSNPKSFVDLITNYDAEQYMKSIWNSSVDNPAHNSYVHPTYLNQLNFNFNYGGLLRFEDVDKVIPMIRDEMKLCPKLPKMSELVELHYIVNVMLPEMCIFGLSQINGTSLDEAREKFETLLASGGEKVVNSNGSAASNGTSSLSSLLMAASRAKEEDDGEQSADI